MAEANLQVLADNRDDLLLAEVAAWLHDMGKCTSEFAYFATARSTDRYDPYKAIFTATELQRYQFSAQRVQERLDEANQQYALHTLLNVQTRQSLDASFGIAGHHYSYRESIYFSRPRFAENIGRPLGRPGEPLDLLAYCHGEGHVEKEDPLPSITPQVVTRHSAFGFSLAKLPEPTDAENLTQRLNSLDWDMVIRHHETEILRSLFGGALGDTRFPINEVTLWDWSSVVASLYKSELAHHFVKGGWRRRVDLRWRILRVNWDELGLYAKAIKIADVLAYQQVVKDACNAVKQLVEVEYPLGNEIYRDTTGIYFTFPDIELPSDLAQKIRRRVEQVEPELAPRIEVEQSKGDTAAEQLKRMLADARTKARGELAQPFNAENLSSAWQAEWEKPDTNKKCEVCPVCRLCPMQEGSDACKHCDERRKSRIQRWEKNPKQTIWLDEIADGNGRLALLVGKFGLDDWLSGDLVQTMLVKAPENNPAGCEPKNPSPARLRRVWETCEGFWTKTVDRFLNALPARERWTLDMGRLPADMPNGAVCDGTLNGQAISVMRQGDHLLTISFVEGKPSGQLIVSWESNRRKFSLTRQIISAKKADEPFLRYCPSLTLLESPDQFLALVPASDALKVAEKIRRQYAKQFGKVQNRLPLSLGLVFFPRKTPLTAVMDTARRMLKEPKDDRRRTTADGRTLRPNEEEWTVAKDVTNGKVEFTNGVNWDFLTTMGDGTTPDVWYPYFIVNNMDVSRHTRRFQLRKQGDTDPQKVGAVSDKYKDCWLVHVNDLRAGDKVTVTPSKVSYIWLESTAQRFRFEPAKDAMRLDELPRLMAMWKEICKTPDMSDTKLQAIRALFENKWTAWRLDEQDDRWEARRDAFCQLVKTTLGKELIQAVSADDVLDGKFKRCLDLHLSILKQGVAEQRKKEKPDEQQLELTTS